MAKLNRSMTFKNAVIDMIEKTITEYDRDNVSTYRIEDVLGEWHGLAGVSVTIKSAEDLCPYEHEGDPQE